MAMTAGPVPELPDYAADELPERNGEEADAATDAEIEEFLVKYTRRDHELLFRSVQKKFRQALSGGESRHNAAVTAACWAAREALVGAYPARFAFDRLRDDFIAAMGTPRPGSGRSLTETQAHNEWYGIFAWAVGQALDADPEEIKRKMRERTRPTDNAATGTSWSASDRLVSGGSFIFDAPDSVPAIWGHDG